MNNFIFEELDNNRIKFNGLDLNDLLDDKFEELLPWHDLFVKYCSDREFDITIEAKESLNSIKAYLGLQLFGENSFNLIKNKYDVYLETAISALDSLYQEN